LAIPDRSGQTPHPRLAFQLLQSQTQPDLIQGRSNPTAAAARSGTSSASATKRSTFPPSATSLTNSPPTPGLPPTLLPMSSSSPPPALSRPRSKTAPPPAPAISACPSPTTGADGNSTSASRLNYGRKLSASPPTIIHRPCTPPEHSELAEPKPLRRDCAQHSSVTAC
jgi:hypothetical protein